MRSSSSNDVEADVFLLLAPVVADNDNTDDRDELGAEVFVQQDIQPPMQRLTSEGAFDFEERIRLVGVPETDDRAVLLLCHWGSCGDVVMMANGWAVAR